MNKARNMLSIFSVFSSSFPSSSYFPFLPNWSLVEDFHLNGNLKV